MSQVKCCLNIFCAYLLTFIDIFIYCYTGTEIPEHWYRMKSFDIAAEFGMDRKMDEWMDKWMGGWMDGQMDGWMDGWTNGWMDGWMDGWMGAYIVSCS